MRAVAYRLRSKQVQTAIIEMQHPKTQRKITLVAMCHQSKRSYFQEMTKEVDALTARGFTVLAEHATTEYTGELLSAIQELKSVTESDEVYPDGLVNQRAYFRPKQVIDCDSPLEGSERTMNRLASELASAAKFVGKPMPRTEELLLTKLNMWFGPLLGRITPTGRAMITRRDRHVVRTVGELLHVELRDIGIVYGAMHMNGIMRGIRRLGYRKTAIRWYTAFTI